jgi:mitochondrial import inner membrane translocase subunit TIM21
MYKRRTLVVVKLSSRHYATHRDAPIYQQPGVGSSSLLSQALDKKERGFRREDSVGPFQLGLSQPSFDNGTAKKWSELSPKGKGQSLSSVFAATNLSRIL